MKNIITNICVRFDKQFNTDIGTYLNNDFDFNNHIYIGNIAEKMIETWPIKTELIQALFNESGANANHYNDDQISFARGFIILSDDCNASHKEVRDFTRSLRAYEILKNLDTVNYWLVTKRVWELADFGDIEKHRLEQTIITEPYNFQIRTSAKVSMTMDADPCTIIYGKINLHYTYGELHIRFTNDTDVYLRNSHEILDKLIEEFGICHFSTKF